jgi:hypothetical protein
MKATKSAKIGDPERERENQNRNCGEYPSGIGNEN